MIKTKFNVGSTRTRKFTSAQAEKVQQGMELFNKVVNSDTFKDRVCNYNWSTENGTTYNRFHMCNGQTNTQVWNSIVNGCDWCPPAMNTTNMVNIVPCATQAEWETICNTMTNIPTVCIDVNCLNNDSYTPVHVACCIMHEYCVTMGFTCNWNGKTVKYWTNTVPVACAWSMMYSIKEVCGTDTKVSNWFNMINENTFDYCACTTTWSAVSSTATAWTNPCVQIDQMINMMMTEVDCISNNTMTKTGDEVNRMTTLNSCIDTLQEMKVKMFATSLDGCERVGMTVIEKEMTVA